MSFHSDGSDERLARLKDIRERKAKTLKDLATVKRGFSIGILTDQSLRSIGAVFDPETNLLQSFRDLNIDTPSKLQKFERVISFVANQVDGVLEAKQRYKDRPAIYNLAESIADSFLATTIAPIAGTSNRLLAELGIVDTGTTTPEELGRATRDLFGSVLNLASFSTQPSEQFAARFNNRIRNMADLDVEDFDNLTSSEQQEVLRAQAAFQGQGGLGIAGAVLGTLAGVSVGFALKVPALGRANILNRILGATGKDAVRSGSTLALAGIAGVIGYGSAPDDSEWHERLGRGLAWSGGIAFVGTALLGRPQGLVARALTLRDRSLRNASATKRFFHNVGTAAIYHPRMTIGDMLKIGAIGAGLRTGELFAAGHPAEEAIYEGSMAAAEWMGYDLAFTRLGGVQRFIDIQTRFSSHLHKNLQVLGFLKHPRFKSMKDKMAPLIGATLSRASSAASLGLAGGLGAAIGAATGAGIAVLSDQELEDGLLPGAAAGGFLGLSVVFRRNMNPIPNMSRLLNRPEAASGEAWARLKNVWAARLESVLPRETIFKVYRGEFGKLTKSEAETIASLVTGDSWKQALMDEATSVAHTVVGRPVLGMRVALEDLSHQEKALYTQWSTLLKQIAEFENAAVPVWDPEHLLALVRVSGIRERMTRIFREKGIDTEATVKVLTQPGGKRLPVDEAIEFAHAMSANATVRYYGGLGRLTPPDPTKLLPKRAAAAKQASQAVVAPPKYARDTITLRQTLNALNSMLRDPVIQMAEITRWVANLGGSLRKGGKSGNVWTLNLPGLPRMKGKNPRKLLQRARAIMNDTPPVLHVEQVKTPLSLKGKKVKPVPIPGEAVPVTPEDLAATLDSVPTKVSPEKGFATVGGLGTIAGASSLGIASFADINNKEDGLAFFPTAAGVAALAGIGVFMIRGRGLRFRSIPKQIRIAGAKLNKLNREGVFIVTNDGTVHMNLGTEEAVSITAGLKADQFVAFSVHNHAPFTSGTTVASGGNLRNILPSSKDIRVIIDNAIPGEAGSAMGAVLSPGTSSITIFRVKPGLRLRGGVREVFIEKLEAEYLLSLNRLFKAVGQDVKGINTNELLQKAEKTFGAENVLRSLIDDVFDPAGIEVIPNVSDDAFEYLLRRHLQLLGVEPPVPLKVAFARAAKEIPSPGLFAGVKISDPTIARRILQIGKGAPLIRPEGGAVKVAPVGATQTKRILPSSITAQSVSRAPEDLRSLKVWAGMRGMSISLDTTTGGRVWVFRAKGSSAEVATGKTIPEAKRNLLRIVEEDQLRRTGASPEEIERQSRAALQGKVVQRTQTNRAIEATVAQTLGFATAIPAAIVGGIVHKALSPDDDQTAVGAAIGFGAGYLIAIKLAFRGGGLRTTAQAEKLLQLVLPEEKLFTISEANVRIGRAGMKAEDFYRFPGTRNRKGEVSVSRDYQTDHIVARAEADSTLKNKKESERWRAVRAMFSKFVPYGVSMQSLDRLEEALKRAASATGHEKDFERAWRGYLNQIAQPPKLRPRTENLNIFSSAHEPEGPMETVQYAEDLKNILINAEVITGIPADAPELISSVIKQSRKTVEQVVSPHAKMLTKLTGDLLDDAMLHQRIASSPVTPQTMTLAGFLPARRIRAVGEKIRLNNPEDGKYIISVFDAVTTETTLVLRDFERDKATLLGIMENFTLAQRKTIRYIREGDGKKTAEMWRKEYEHKNPDLIRAANAFDKLLRQRAKDAGIPEELLIEGYFPWIYSQRTIKEMQKNGLIKDEPLTIPNYGPWPKIKILRAMHARLFNEPAGPIIEDPIEAGLIYLYNVSRKIHVDNILAVVTPKALKDLSLRQPWVARSIIRWIHDIHGIPSKGTQQARAFLDNIGLAFESRFPDMPDWSRALLDKYFNTANPHGLANMVRGFEFMSKLGFMVTSPLVNLTQTLINGGVEVGLHNLFLGTLYVGAGKAVSAKGFTAGRAAVGGALVGGGIGGLVAGEDNLLTGVAAGAAVGAGLGGAVGAKASLVRAIPRQEFMEQMKTMAVTAPWLEPFAGGRYYRQLAEEGGVLAQAFHKQVESTIIGFSNMATVKQSVKEAGAGKILKGAAVGAGLGTVLSVASADEDTDLVRPDLIATGALLGGAARTAMLRYAAHRTLHAATWLFNIAESINRNVTASGAALEARGALRAAAAIKGGKSLSKVRSVERISTTAESTVVGAGVGAATGALLVDDPDDRGEAAALGAGIGALGGAMLGVVSEPRKLKVMREITEFEQTSLPLIRNLRKEFMKEGPITEEEATRWIMEQYTMMTQFNFGRASRGTYLRTPLGEGMFALQTYMLNQAEFLGERWSSFMRSMPGKEGSLGNIDTRILRHMMLLMGAGSVMTALYGFTGDERGPNYWASRIGFGLMPFVIWNEAAQKWNIVNPASALAGPFVTDVVRTTMVYFKLATDPVARTEWTQNIDGLFERLLPMLKQTRNTPETVGAALDFLGHEGLAEYARSAEKTANQLSSPLSLATARPARVDQTPGSIESESSGLPSLPGLPGLPKLPEF